MREMSYTDAECSEDTQPYEPFTPHNVKVETDLNTDSPLIECIDQLRRNWLDTGYVVRWSAWIRGGTARLRRMAQPY